MPGAAAELALNVVVTTTGVVTTVTTTVATVVVLPAVASAATVAAVTTTGVVVVAAVVGVVFAALAAVVVVVAAGRVVVVASDVVDGGAASSETKACIVVLTPALKGDGMRVELPERHDVKAGCGSDDEGLILAIEASDDGGDDVLITHGAVDSSKLVSVGADLGEVVRHGEGFLPEDRHVQLDLHNSGTAMGLVHLLEMLPDGTRCVKPVHLLKNFVDEGGEQVAEDDLVLTEPGGVLRIGSTDTLVIGGNQPIGRELGAIDIASGIGDAKGGGRI